MINSNLEMKNLEV